MAKLKIKGKVSFQNLGTGFYGIIDENGKEWRPVSMPNQIKYDGKAVEIIAKEVEEEMSIFMWGTPIQIISFSTMMP
ncbi:MAG: hypothetical protein MRY78_18595 [Saprospiraceae bacterium]|nr:hypothetical protein [Saprospiraceae bacterium]